jgi:hypothetical protein
MNFLSTCSNNACMCKQIFHSSKIEKLVVLIPDIISPWCISALLCTLCSKCRIFSTKAGDKFVCNWPIKFNLRKASDFTIENSDHVFLLYYFNLRLPFKFV